MRNFGYSFLLACCVALITTPAIAQQQGKHDTVKSSDDLIAARQAAANRQRRLIFNNDGNEPYNIMTRPSVEQFLELRTTPLIGSQVDSIFYCSSICFGLFTHFTKVGQVFTATEGQYKDNQLAAMQQLGIDPLAEMISFCRQQNIEIFCSMRMNDTHDGAVTAYGPILFSANKLKKRHPEYLLGKQDEKISGGKWSAVNYGLPEIRDLAFRYVEEIAVNYDVDGIELDFFRHPLFFPSTAQREPATDEELNAMTDLLRRIRSRIDQVSQERGKAILLAIRIPDSSGYCRAIGLDVDKWMHENLIDLMTTCSYFQLNDWQYSADWGHKHGVKVYASLDESRIRDEPARRRRMSHRAYRGRAANAFAAGMDGVYLFNSFNPRSSLWRELGDPNLLATLDKVYFASIRGSAEAAGGNFPKEPYQSCETLNPTNPKPLRPNQTTATKLYVAETQDRLNTNDVLLLLEFSDNLSSVELTIQLNGTPLNDKVQDKNFLRLKPPKNALKPGANVVEVTLQGSTDEPIKWKDLMLEVGTPDPTNDGESQ